MSATTNDGKNQNFKHQLAQNEEEVLSFWKENDIFAKSLAKPSPQGEFIFYEGPPTANGRPGIHHLLSRAFKDIILRYKTMQGFHVRRKAGWDTHGLPVELEVEKSLGLKSKKEIEEFGVAAFNRQCKENVWKYIDEWERFTERIGYWLDQKDAYVTYKTKYIESLWWIIKQIADKKLLYKDYKVVPWCPRCGTALSSHELAQGYRDVKDLSVYVKFKLKTKNEKQDTQPTYLLAWTTTPWTLPGNIALAVGEDIDYVEIEKQDMGVGKVVKFILAENRLSEVFGDDQYTITKKMKGKELVGLEYEPLFPYLQNVVSQSEKDKFKNAYKIYGANFVTTDEGTGIVHTAVMYGQDDFELGTQVGLPKCHLVGEDGKFLPGTGELEGKFVKDEQTDVLIIKYLHDKNLLFKKEKYEHSYPFCWRCGTPLIYFARDSWYVAMSRLRDELVKENEKINWEPSHTKEGRFGEWLRDVKDWAFSRERYWGTPLPIWESEDKNTRLVIGSLDDLKKYSRQSGNRFVVMRHGESERNVLGIMNSDNTTPTHITKKGKEEVEEAVKKLKKEKIDYIFVSPLIRTQETAKLVAKLLDIPQDRMVTDDRLRELESGVMNGKPVEEYHRFFASYKEYFVKAPQGGENLTEIKRRMGGFLYDVDKKYQNKTILVISHEHPLWMLESAASGLDVEEAIKIKEDWGDDFIKTGEARNLEFTPLPHNEDFEVDLHRPYIDDFILYEDGQELRRVKEVADVWFDSGSMPVAEDHYPFENKKWIEGKGYPADYITEAIDQTRGWFYTLHAVGVLLGKGRAFNNVICLGHIMDAEGKKMSKSIGNVVDPWTMADKYGADALRFWMYSINQPGESKNFDEKTVDEVVKKVFNLLTNVHTFYELYTPANLDVKDVLPESILDKWILARLAELSMEVTKGLDSYKILEPARAVRDFIGDLSQWYIRRSRERFKGNNEKDKMSAVYATRKVLVNLAKIMAPFTPFLAEDLYRKLRSDGDKESVHLDNWPFEDLKKFYSEPILRKMSELRDLASLGLQARATAGVKVRQPLAGVTIKSEGLKGEEEYLQILADELNVKEISFDPSMPDAMKLDADITEELKQEGNLRDLIRTVQNARKDKGLNPHQKIELIWFGEGNAAQLVESQRDVLIQSLNLSSLEKSGTDQLEKVDLNGFKISFSLKI
ncbi:MAG: hypothetical protein A2653_00420 [Candidatus Zambryskibacteria bacterium RIFCSPHIGHO2_01_FULL_43_25]|uniref:Isoleucine--tRNA ligase n=1 Tax=Candidatus Zambryskibacteria bacterium RIFCSPLOWO2_01_FULL_45_21 TaxID=1802761 RepID=A0A1G2U378_9BACT|nr:MAG: hypothetical protein A2653_00420 [Candidatus Zambryskibacteria bacterium RIFCSPHIGHO2_01_FULL_43_25]OHB00892.1 MAG: hypothetical protein A3E94_01405 [Candidatus Zambryskibacteria bacterium RIFCSPHIGHO2_12_FULL_44_12b]OHB03330.1 MAG: hypothetical protein A3B14_00255 [Candidatus Zambryskibacteria bacterium RIFCSPLOWO2_01_FULL_45_21]